MIKFLLERIAPVHIDTESIRYLYIKMLNFHFYAFIHASVGQSLLSTYYIKGTDLYRFMFIHIGYIPISISLCVCIYTDICIFIYLCVYIQTYICIFIYLCMYTHICIDLVFLIIYFNFKYFFNLGEKLSTQAQFSSSTRMPGIPVFSKPACISYYK